MSFVSPNGNLFPIHNSLGKQLVVSVAELAHHEIRDPVTNTAVFRSHRLSIVQFTGNYTTLPANLAYRFESMDATAQKLTIPAGMGVQGDVIEICQMGAGKLTVIGDGTSTIRSPGGRFSVAEQYGTIGAVCNGGNYWTLSGHLSL